MIFLAMYITGALVVMLCLSVYVIDKSDAPEYLPEENDALIIITVGLLWLLILAVILGKMILGSTKKRST